MLVAGRCGCRKSGARCSSKCHNGKPCSNEKDTTLPQRKKPLPKKFKLAEEISSDEDLCTPLKNRLRQCSSMTATKSVGQEDIIHIEGIQGMQLFHNDNQLMITKQNLHYFVS